MPLSVDFDPTRLDWQKNDGLIPVVVQDATSLRVLMLGYMNQEALEQTLQTSWIAFYSRSRQRLWRKGETSGHSLRLLDLRADCDGDTLLALAEPLGPTCHTGAISCFGQDSSPNLSVLGELARTIRQRKQNPLATSYTSSLLAQSIARIAQKVGEEGVETALAAATQSPTLPEEAADLVYHLLVLLEACETDFKAVLAVLRQRAKPKDAAS